MELGAALRGGDVDGYAASCMGNDSSRGKKESDMEHGVQLGSWCKCIVHGMGSGRSTEV